MQTVMVDSGNVGRCHGKALASIQKTMVVLPADRPPNDVPTVCCTRSAVGTRGLVRTDCAAGLGHRSRLGLVGSTLDGPWTLQRSSGRRCGQTLNRYSTVSQSSTRHRRGCTNHYLLRYGVTTGGNLAKCRLANQGLLGPPWRPRSTRPDSATTSTWGAAFDKVMVPKVRTLLLYVQYLTLLWPTRQLTSMASDSSSIFSSGHSSLTARGVVSRLPGSVVHRHVETTSLSS